VRTTSHWRAPACRADGKLYQCGETDFGQGNSGANSNFRYHATRIFSESGFVQLAAGESHFLALKSDGSVYAWGLSDWGQSAYGTTTVAPVHKVTLPGPASVIAAGYLHSYALVC
jgi:alpha-tubulin suppressor-like RCC1 family protein